MFSAIVAAFTDPPQVLKTVVMPDGAACRLYALMTGPQWVCTCAQFDRMLLAERAYCAHTLELAQEWKA